ncbi:MAG: hypothetical protein ACYC46_06175 [Acidobacteriaceae bacterium]
MKNARITTALLPLLLAATLVISGCTKKPDQSADTAAASDTTQAQQAASNSSSSTSSAEPGLRRRESSRQGPASAPQPKVYTVPAGTAIAVRTSGTLSARDNNVGDAFSGSLVQPIVVDGVTLVPAGTSVNGTVIAAKGQGRFKGAGDLGITINTVGPYQVTTSDYEKVQKGKGKRTAGMIGGGAGLGALIGGLAGGGKGAAIGALAGAGAGTAGAAYTGNKNVIIPAESVIRFTLQAPFSVTTQP